MAYEKELHALLFRLFREGAISVDWRKNATGIQFHPGAEQIIQEQGLDMSKEDFSSVALDYLDKLRQLVLGNEQSLEKETLRVLEALLREFPYLRDEINVKCRSNLGLLDFFDHEILTKRTEQGNIVAFSCLVNLVVSPAYSTGDEGTRQVSFEVTQNELQEIIAHLEQARDRLESFNVKDRGV